MKTESFRFLYGPYMLRNVLEAFPATSFLSCMDGFSPTKTQIIRFGKLVSG